MRKVCANGLGTEKVFSAFNFSWEGKAPCPAVGCKAGEASLAVCWNSCVRVTDR